MNWLELVLSVVAESALTALFIALIFNPYQKWRTERKFGGWKVLVKDSGEIIETIDLTADEAKDFNTRPTQLAVLIKGKGSPHLIWEGDPLSDKAKEKQLVVIDEINRTYIINIEKGKRRNPKDMKPVL